MSIYVVIEPEYATSTWCAKIAQGISDEAKHKKTEVFFASAEFKSCTDDLIALIGNSPNWICDTLKKLQNIHPAHFVLISNTPYNLSISSIGTDLFHSMLDILSYLKNDCQKKHIAFYGVNASSTTDLLKLQGFPDQSHVYYNNSNLSACFQNFYENISKYDAVICANDFAAVSLLQNLKQQDFSQIKRLFIVSFSNLHIAEKYMPSITSVSLDYYEYGCASVNWYKMILKNPQIDTGNINIKCNIIPRASTNYIPFSRTAYTAKVTPIEESTFFEDPEITNLFSLEKLFTTIEEIDEKILASLLKGNSYEQTAHELFMSVNGIKYRLQKLLDYCGFKSRKELLNIYQYYFDL